MERIRMTKIEKYILRMLNDNPNSWSVEQVLKHFNFEEIEVVAYSFEKLQEEELIKAVINYSDVLDAHITAKGKAYLHEYPDLENLEDPLKLERETRRLAYITLGISIASLAISVAVALFK